MIEPWQPEEVVTLQLAKQLIERQFPELSPVVLLEYGNGFDNTVFLVNDQYIFRFPRREIAVKLLEKENRFLPLLFGKLPLSIPKPVYIGQPEESYPWPFSGYPKVKGETTCGLERKASLASIPDLAHFLKKLHNFPVKIAQNANVPFDEFGRSDMIKRRPILEELTDKIVQRELIPNPEQLSGYLETLEVVQSSKLNTVVHGDLHIRNILVDHDGKLSGVIDWGDLHIGDPAVDLSIVYSFLPPESRPLFFREYGNVDRSTKVLARFIAVYILAVLLLYGADHGDSVLMETCRDGLEWAIVD